VRKAYRRLSLVLHPDKNQADDAELKFRWLAAIYETLKDPKKREIYDRVLVEGLPDWRMPAYYFRRMRKVGLAEGLAYLLVLTTVVQYAVNWAAYWERKFTMRESVSTHLNKRSTQKKVKRAGKDVDADKIEDELENQLENMGFTKPTILGLLPFQIMRGTKDACFGIPKLPSRIYSSIQEHKRIKEEEENRIKEEEEEFERKDNEKKERKEQQRQRKLAQKQYAEKEGMIHKTNKTRTQTAEEVKKLPRNAQQLWTDEDLAKLAKLIKKFPGGTTDRWETIAEMMERLPWEVTKMAGTIKGTCYQVSTLKFPIES
jgi:DnaJ family protein C protein 1